MICLNPARMTVTVMTMGTILKKWTSNENGKLDKTGWYKNLIPFLSLFFLLVVQKDLMITVFNWKLNMIIWFHDAQIWPTIFFFYYFFNTSFKILMMANLIFRLTSHKNSPMIPLLFYNIVERDISTFTGFLSLIESIFMLVSKEQHENM